MGGSMPEDRSPPDNCLSGSKTITRARSSHAPRRPSLRPDVAFAAYVSIKAEKTKGRFVKVGDKLGNATVTASSRDGIELTFDDGTKSTLAFGEPPVELEEVSQ